MAENYFGITDTGKLRENNEDAFIAEKILDNRYILACVIDGVGGYAGGEVAAAIARQAILDYFSILSGDIATMIKEALVIANKKIYEEKLIKPEYNNMACVATLAIADINYKQFYYGHVGDTRLYLMRDHSLIKVTKDHSFVGFLEDTGRLSEEAAMNHPKRNEIDKALGFSARIQAQSDYIETGVSPFLPGDLLLLCSDGLSDLLSTSEILSVLTNNKTLQEKGQRLVEAANFKGGKDNITVVLVHNHTKPIKQKATKPIAVKKKPGLENNEAQEEIVSVPETQPTKKDNASNTIIAILSVICIVLLAGCLYLLLRNDVEEKIPQTRTQVKEEPKPQQDQLTDTITRSTDKSIVLNDSLFITPVLVSDTLWIEKDSLHIKGKDRVVFTADSAYTGPAIVVSPECRYLLLENITLENFDVGILVQNKAVRLKNVQFNNCLVPVQYQFSFPDSFYVTGKIGETSSFKTDSLPKK